MSYSKLVGVSRAALKNSIQLKPDEKVVIVSNPGYDVEKIARSLYEAADGLGGIPVLIFQRKKSQLDYAEPPAIEALDWADVILSISRDKLGKDPTVGKEGYKMDDLTIYHRFNYLKELKKFRGAWTPTITEKIYLQCVDVDYQEMHKYCKEITERLEGSEKIRVSSRNGTEITFSVEGRKLLIDDGLFNEPGKGGNWPAGEVAVAPSLETANGTVVFDGSLDVLGETLFVEKKPVKVKIEDGYVSKISGYDTARRLENDIHQAMQKAREMERDHEYVKASKLLGEFGIGTNKNATIHGNMLVDEKVRGTCHFAIGSNLPIGGKSGAINHFDGLVQNPTITYDSSVLMKDGKLLSKP